MSRGGRVPAVVPTTLGALCTGLRVVEVAEHEDTYGTVSGYVHDAEQYRAAMTLRTAAGERRVEGPSWLRVVVREAARPGHGATAFHGPGTPWSPWTVRHVDQGDGVVRATPDRVVCFEDRMLFVPVENVRAETFVLDSRGDLRARSDRALVLRIGRRWSTT